MKAVVTGGCGFIGSALIREIVKRNWDVSVYDNFTRFGPDHIGESLDAVTVLKGDVQDSDRLRRALKGADIVFHLAANSRQSGSMESPNGYFGPNTIGTYNVAEACRGTSTRIVYASTCAVYAKEGIRKWVGVSEDAPIKPATPYALSKRGGEEWLGLYAKIYGEDAVIFRFPAVYGPGDKDRIVPSMIKRAIGNEKITVFGNPRHLNFVHVSDVAHALFLAGTRRNLKHSVFNIGSRRNVNLKDLAELIVGTLASSSKVVVAPLPGYELPYLRPSIELARRELGYEPRRKLKEGVQEMISQGRADGGVSATSQARS